MNNRRKLVVALGAGALVAPFGTFAQRQGKVSRIGFLYYGSRQSVVASSRLSAFLQGMRDLGYVEGRNLIVNPGFSEGDLEQTTAVASELVARGAQVMVAVGTVAGRAAQLATSAVPIVVILTPDPVRDGFAMSWARPGGNLTGLSTGSGDYIQKHLELLTAVVPTMRRIGVVLNPTNYSHPALLLTVQALAEPSGRLTMAFVVDPKERADRNWAAIERADVQALMMLPDSYLFQKRGRLIDIAQKRRLPTVHQAAAFAEDGGLMAYGPDLGELCRRGAVFVDKLLKGGKAAEMPFEQPTRYSFTLNLKTAGVLGVKIPDSVRVIADRVIE